MISKYVEALDSDKTPVIMATWDSVVAQQSEKARTEALQVYSQIDAELERAGDKQVDLGALHARLKRDARQAYVRIAIQDEKSDAIWQQLDAELEKRFVKLQQTYLENARNTARQFLRTLIDELAKKIESLSSFEEYERMLKEMWKHYNAHANVAVKGRERRREKKEEKKKRERERERTSFFSLSFSLFAHRFHCHG
jgi:hypothetical protein